MFCAIVTCIPFLQLANQGVVYALILIEYGVYFCLTFPLASTEAAYIVFNNIEVVAS